VLLGIREEPLVSLDHALAGIAAPMGRCTTHHFAQFTDVVATMAYQDLGNSTMDVGWALELLRPGADRRMIYDDRLLGCFGWSARRSSSRRTQRRARCALSGLLETAGVTRIPVRGSITVSGMTRPPTAPQPGSRSGWLRLVKHSLALGNLERGFVEYLPLAALRIWPFIFVRDPVQ
jgi:hypothetical protein